MDEFAQTRAPDDLFDDDFTPVAQPSPAQPPPPIPPPQPAVAAAAPPSASRGVGPGQGQGAQHRSKAARDRRGKEISKAQRNGQKEGDGNAVEQGKPEPEGAVPVSEQQRGEPDGAKEHVRVEAVKGDRSGTGGVKQVSLAFSKPFSSFRF